MIGDKLIIEARHTARAQDICTVVTEYHRLKNDKLVISIAGESGSGKSELASEVARQLTETDINAGILQQDDYFVFPPETNHTMRQRNLDQVSVYEVKLDFLDSNLRSFKRNDNPIYKPLVIFNEDRIITEEIDTTDTAVLIAEGTYTSLLKFSDAKFFIDLNYRQTLEARKRRARDSFDPFINDVLEIEHRIIAGHRKMADFIIPADYGGLVRSQKS